VVITGGRNMQYYDLFVQTYVVRAQLMSQSNDAAEFGESWLFYGCRHKERDYLYRLFDAFATVVEQMYYL